MEKRSLGKSGLQVSRIGLGCVTFGREIDEKMSFEMMDYAVSQGVNLFDTAEGYGGGESERIVGRWLSSRGCREQIILQSKVKPPFTQQHIREALDGSRARLGVNQIDIYLLHEFDNLVPLEEALRAMTLAVHSGHVRSAGCSNFTVEQLHTAETMHTSHGLTRFEVIQPVYNLVAKEVERQLLPYCAENAIGVVSYSPLAAGFLTGKYSPGPASILPGSRFDLIPGHRDIYFNPANDALVEELRVLSARSEIPIFRLALGWVLANPDVDSVLVGGTSVSHIRNAMDAIRSPLDPALIEEMNCLGSN